MRKKALFFFLLFIPLFQVYPGSTDIHLTGNFKSIIIKDKIRILYTDHHLEKEEVARLYFAGKFVDEPLFKPPGANLSRLHYWASFTIHNETAHDLELFLVNFDAGLTRNFNLFHLRNEDRFLSARDVVKINRNLFSLKIKAGEKETLFIHFERYKYRLAIRLFSSAFYETQKNNDNVFNGVYFGILFVMTLYNLMLVFSLKKRSYIFYIIFNLTFALHFFIKYTAVTIPFGLEGSRDMIIIAVRNMTGIFLIFFARDFLKSKSFSPRLDKAVKGLVGLSICGTLIFIVTGVAGLFILRYIFLITSFLAVFIILFISIGSLRKKFRPALFFLIAVGSILAIQLTLSIMTFLTNILPFSLSDLYNLRLVEVAQLIMIIVFSLGLADSIKVIRDLKEKALEEMVIQTRKSLRIEAEKEGLKNELALAKHIQTILIPRNIIHEDFEIASIMLPAEEVGGDYFNVTYGYNDNFWISIGDVSGHGMSSGLIMMIVLTIHSTITSSMNLSPSDAVKTVNRVLLTSISDYLRKEYMMSFTSLKYQGKGVFLYSGLHMPIIIYRKKKERCDIIYTEGLFLNLVPNISNVTKNKKLKMDVGDILILYTDGIIEARNDQKEQFDIPGITGIVEKNAHMDIDVLKNTIISQAIQWCNYKQTDDMSLIIVKRKK